MRIWESLRREYGNLKIQTKFYICISIAIATPFLILGSLFATRLYDMVVADTIRTEQEAAWRTAPRVGAVVWQIKNAYDSIAKSEYFQLMMGEISEEELETDVFVLQRNYEGVLSQHIHNGSITDMKIYVDMPQAKIPYPEMLTPASEVKGTYWYGIFQGSDSRELYCPDFYLGNREKQTYGNCAYAVERSFRYEGEEYPCYMVFYYSNDLLEQILKENTTVQGSVSYIVNDREAVIASSDDYLTGIYYIKYEDIADSLMSSNNFVERTILGEKVYVAFNMIEQTEWFLVTVTPSDPLYQQAAKVLLGFLGICLICIMGAFWLATRQSNSITTRISSLAHRMAMSRKGSPVAMPSPQAHDEVGELIETYNYMAGTINELMKKQQETAEELRIAEFKSLQAQINPHFLYNTMDMINWMALQGHTAEISNAVQQLARFYKLTLSRKSNFMSIEEETEHVSIYVELQNMRFQNAIDFVIDIPDELLNYNIPKLTLQPIVENAIIHGIFEKEEKEGTIVITGWLEDDYVVLLVSDDGVGIPPERLSRILTGANTSTAGGTNIAVYNIHRRLKLLYGEECGLRYSSTEGKGTEVQIKIKATVDDTDSKRTAQ